MREATLTLNVTFKGPDSANKKLVESKLRLLVYRAYEEGLLTGGADMEVDILDMDAKAHPTKEENAANQAELEELLNEFPES